MFEIELKFQVPAHRQAALRRAVATASAQTSRLQARYFDTADRRLAHAGVALRLRQEDRVWVQTLKGRGENGIRRIEHEVVLADDAAPHIDTKRHDGTEAGRLLAQALGGKDVTLQQIFATDIHRTHRLIRSGAAVVELAFDQGELLAGDARLPVCELEMELKSGALDGLFELAQRWAGRHGLWLDVRSKAERGELLARGQDANAAVKASPPVLKPEFGSDAALRAMVASCLEQILPNAAALAAEVGGSAQHLHQARIGLRRLRTALRVFGEWSAGVDADWEAALAELFAQLGRQRDRDALSAGLLPALRAAGMPDSSLTALAPLPPGAPGELLRAPDTVALWLQLLAFALSPAVDEPASPALKRRAASLIRDLRRQVRKDARQFAKLDDGARHRLRKRLKRLRYAIELASPCFPAKPVKRYLAALRPAQDALGRYNDLCVAEALFRAEAAENPQAWFAVGWLVASRGQQAIEAATALDGARAAAAGWVR